MLTPRSQDYSKWYGELVKQAQLAENSDVRGCMIIKPYGFAIRETIKHILDEMFKNTGHQNAYFPLFIPKSYFSKEASHIAGFAKECAVVTHYRLKNNEHGQIDVDPEAKLEEELIVRPTSETIIWHTYKDRIQSHRDLPLLINQRANVVRREMRTRPFLRTAEFLWQEGHTAHATKEEAIAETAQMLDVYLDFATNFLGMYSITGRKPDFDKFAGADHTLSFEPMMQDGKALQAGTSHFLGQTFAKAFDVTFKNKHNQDEYVRATSRGVSTRMMGGLIMAHSDDKGLVLPPSIAPLHVVIIPIAKTQEDVDQVRNYLSPITELLDDEHLQFHSTYFDQKLQLKYQFDNDLNHGFGWKCTQYELQGVPVRIVAGRKEMEQGMVEVYTRWNDRKELMSLETALTHLDKFLYSAQNGIFQKHFTHTMQHLHIVDDYETFKEKITTGFVLAHRDGTEATALKIQDETGATIRNHPHTFHLNNCSDTVREHLNTAQLDHYNASLNTPGLCILTGKPSAGRVLFARAY